MYKQIGRVAGGFLFDIAFVVVFAPVLMLCAVGMIYAVRDGVVGSSPWTASGFLAWACSVAACGGLFWLGRKTCEGLGEEAGAAIDNALAEKT